MALTDSILTVIVLVGFIVALSFWLGFVYLIVKERANGKKNRSN